MIRTHIPHKHQPKWTPAPRIYQVYTLPAISRRNAATIRVVGERYRVDVPSEFAKVKDTRPPVLLMGAEQHQVVWWCCQERVGRKLFAEMADCDDLQPREEPVVCINVRQP